MIHELLKDSGAAEGLIGGEAKIYPLTGVLQPSPSPSTTTSSTAAAATPITSSENQNQLRCPRCNSSNTKFCYYNNYNLTQPRHFCKTCRRYWTKGGALRNVPIGGGCRKNNKSAGLMPSFGKLSNGKLKTVVSSEIGKPSGFLDHHELIPSPFQRASAQSTHLLDFLRSTQNPNLTLNSVSAKEEGFLIGAHLSSDPGVASGSFNARTACSSYFWRNNSQNLDQHHQQQQNGFIVGEVHNTGLSDHLYQRISLRASVNYYSDNLPAAHVGNMTCSSNSSAILESAAVAGGDQLGNNYWNYPSLSWSDLPTTNGAYP